MVQLLFTPSRLISASLALASLMAVPQTWASSLWVNEQNVLRPVALEAARRLANAGNDGLNPAHYGGAQLLQTVQASQGRPLDPASASTLDAQLTEKVELYLHHLRNGRVDPRQIREHYDANKTDWKAFDAPTALREALGMGNLASAFDAATPRVPMYDELRKALERERQLASDPAWAGSLPALPKGGKLGNGQAWSGLTMLTQRLVAMGDLPAGTAAPATYNSTLQDGVKAFQQRYGLPENGVLNKATLDKLNESPKQRADRIALAMERLRWTPLLQGHRTIVVNVPEFRLRAYDNAGGQPEPKVSMRVIVGKALDTRTPMFDEDMRYIEFSPYWNVPPSIARSETIPKIRRDPGYMARNGFEIVGQGGLQGVLNGTARIRQKPGPSNALGDIKFVFPNNQNIYLHHTSSPGLFKRTKRDFSHGCIRVEEPVQLAKFVLQDDPAWTEDRIRKAMGAGKATTVRLKEPLPVVITYMTTVISNGQLLFFPDLYGHDRKLAHLLAQGKTTRVPPKSATPLQKNSSAASAPSLQ